MENHNFSFLLYFNIYVFMWYYNKSILSFILENINNFIFKNYENYNYFTIENNVRVFAQYLGKENMTLIMSILNINFLMQNEKIIIKAQFVPFICGNINSIVI